MHRMFKVIVAVDMLVTLYGFAPWPPGHQQSVLIWDGYGPSRTQGDFFDFEVGGHDGAYKGRIHDIVIHLIVPFIGRKKGTLGVTPRPGEGISVGSSPTCRSA